MFFPNTTMRSDLYVRPDEFPASLVMDIMRTHPGRILSAVFTGEPVLVPPDQFSVRYGATVGPQERCHGKPECQPGIAYWRVSRRE